MLDLIKSAKLILGMVGLAHNDGDKQAQIKYLNQLGAILNKMVAEVNK